MNKPMINIAAAKSLVAFGLAVLLGSIVIAFLLDALTVDLLSLIVIVLGLSVGRGSRRAAKWALVFMVYYIIISAAMAIVLLTGHGEIIKIGGASIKDQHVPWLVVSLLVFTIWSALNLALLLKSLKILPVTSAPQTGREIQSSSMIPTDKQTEDPTPSD